MKIKKLYLEALEKLSEKDVKKIILSLGTIVSLADCTGLLDEAYNTITNKNATTVEYTLPSGYMLDKDGMGYRELITTEWVELTKNIDPNTGEVTYSAPAGYMIKGNKAYRTVITKEYVEPEVVYTNNK